VTSGVVRGALRLRSAPIIWVFHDVADALWFERCIDEIASAREVLPLAEVARMPRSRKACAITFDDGLRSVLDVARPVLSERDERRARYELAGPEVLTYDEIALTVARAAGRERPLLHVPLGLVHLGLVSLRRALGEAVFATWEEAELMEVPMTTARGTADAESLGVTPLPVSDVLGGA
jgi:uncharacterized protein YbjT (DUF2867 family)